MGMGQRLFFKLLKLAINKINKSKKEKQRLCAINVKLELEYLMSILNNHRKIEEGLNLGSTFNLFTVVTGS